MKKAFIYLIVFSALLITIVVETLVIIDMKRHPEFIPGDVIRDTTWLPSKDSIVYKPGKLIVKDTTIYSIDTLFRDVDTMAILRQFYATNVYRDSLVLPDSLGAVYTLDSISQNEIQGRKWTSKTRQKVITEKVYLETPKRNQVYVGVESNWGIQSRINTVGAGVLLKTKKDFIIGVDGGGLNYQSQWDWYVGGKMYWKIRLRK